MTITESIDARPGDEAPLFTETPDVVTSARQKHQGPDSIDLGLARARILILLVGYGIIGAAAGGIFDRLEWVLVASPVFPTIGALLVVGRSGALRAIAAVVGIAMSVVLAVIVKAGSSGDVLDALTSGIQGLLSTEWPSPIRADLVGAVAAVTATATAVSDELAIRRRFHLLPLVPLLLCYVGVIGLSSALGVTWAWLIPLSAVAAVFAMFRNDGTLRDRLVLLRGERRVIPLFVVAVALVAFLAVPMSLTSRADPRRNDPAETTSPLLDPIEATIALRKLDPPIDLHRVTMRSEQPLPFRWRTAALENYDGRRWTPRLTLRPIGTTLGPISADAVSVDVTFLDDNLSLVPLPGEPVSVDAAIETDPDRTVVRLAEPPVPGDEVGVVANLAPSMNDASELGVSPRLVEEDGSTLDDLAEALAGGGSPIDQLVQLETALRTDFVLDSDVQGGGLQQALIDRFLRDTRRGTREQFSTAFVLLARSLGIEARVATGFVADSSDEQLPTGDLILGSADAEVWPEVQLSDGRWLAFDPIPPEEATDGAPPAPEPQVQTPAAPQPPLPPSPEPDTNSPAEDEELEVSSTSALSTALTWALRSVAAIGAILIPFIAAAVIVLGVKKRRRRRRLRAKNPNARIFGAWASATDALVDAGLDISAADTDGEIAHAGRPLVAGGERDLHRLALLASAAAYGRPEHPDLFADDAKIYLHSVETSMAGVRTPWQRFRWRLSLRSLRPSTRSPVIS